VTLLIITPHWAYLPPLYIAWLHFWYLKMPCTHTLMPFFSSQLSSIQQLIPCKLMDHWCFEESLILPKAGWNRSWANYHRSKHSRNAKLYWSSSCQDTLRSVVMHLILRWSDVLTVLGRSQRSQTVHVRAINSNKQLWDQKPKQFKKVENPTISGQLLFAQSEFKPHDFSIGTASDLLSSKHSWKYSGLTFYCYLIAFSWSLPVKR
jgi:hypothetical protein